MKVQTTLRFGKKLLELVKENAAEKRSLNNYIEYLLYHEVREIPNSETEKAIAETRKGENPEPNTDLD